MEGPDFLKLKYNLHNSSEVESAANRTESRTGEEVHSNTTEQIQNYLNRFKEIIDRTDPEKRERGMEALKHLMYENFVIKENEIPEGYFQNQQRLARERGHGDIEISEEQKSQFAEVIITDQKSSLDTWIDYLSSADATYPDWLKYYAFRSITGMGEYDKEKHQFTKRSTGTTKPFPDLNREALAYVLDAIEKKHKGGLIPKTDNPEVQAQFEKLLQGENFAKLYAWAIDKCTPASKEALSDTRGEWVKYNQNSDHMPLVESLQGHGTGWCTAGESTAQAQLENGDFYVYYSFDTNGSPAVPRVAIRMEGDNIAEVRGIASGQNIDSFIAPVVQAKMKEFPDGEKYEKKCKDMETLTNIEKKIKDGKKLSKEELKILYQIDYKIEGFGHGKDPRIMELIKGRNVKEDLSIIFECLQEEIAHGEKEVNLNTKVCVKDFFGGEGVLLYPQDIVQDAVFISIIENKIKLIEKLSKKDLIFLYELDRPIKYFNNSYPDSRIKEFRRRDIREDLQTIFGYSTKEIALKKEEINENTKIYVGAWSPDVLNLIPESCVHLYERFPDKKIYFSTIETNPTIESPEDMERILIENGYDLSDDEKEVMRKVEFSNEIKRYKLVSFPPSVFNPILDLEDKTQRPGAYFSDVYNKSQEFGLRLCPAEVAPILRLNYEDKKYHGCAVAMSPISIKQSNGTGRDYIFALTNVFRPALIITQASPIDYFSDDNYRFIFLLSDR